MKSAFRLVRRGTQFYAHRRITLQRETLHTSHRQLAEKLLAAMNDAERAPTMTLLPLAGCSSPPVTRSFRAACGEP
jgi:hypothetical protein